MTKTELARTAWGSSYLGSKDIAGVRMVVRVFTNADSLAVEAALERLDTLEKALSEVLPAPSAPKPEVRA